MGIIEQIALWVAQMIEALHYPGLCLMMALESMVAPVPSEVIMPLAGFLVEQGTFSWAGAILASSLGTILGSWIGYLMGRYGGYPLILRFGKYLLLDREHLDFTVRWFEKRGELTIFVSRFIPIVRHLISVPAGVGRMNPWTFTFYTLLGGTIWNTILLAAGVWLKERWEVIHTYSTQIDWVVLALGVILCAWWIWRQLRRRRARAQAAKP